jgi:hypothetical protein
MTSDAQPGIEALRVELEAARGELIEALEGIRQEEFVRRPPGEVIEGEERWPVRDVLWHVGYSDDWTRRAVDHGLRGEAAPPFEHRRRPAYLNTPELLREWLDQSRRPTLSLMRRMRDDDLEREVRLASGRSRRIGDLLREAAAHDREHAEQVRALRALPPPPER